MKTVFVIGAGANVEIGMPSGKELKESIAEFLDFSSLYADRRPKSFDVFYAMRNIFHTDEQTNNIALTIREGMPVSISIDNFIDAHRLEYGIAIAGKIAIVASIIDAEKQSYLINIKKFQDDLSKTWYPLFFQKIAEGCEINEFIERLKNISFIIFNYDRCFEFYMIYAIDAYYKIGKEKAFNLVNQMNIIHPYGVIGDLKKVLLGQNLDYKRLIELYQNIRTFAEDSEETKKERTAIKHFIDRANRVIFLGFAYHQMNLDLIFKYPGYAVTLVDDAPITERFDCYGTGYGISKNDREYIQYLLRRMTPKVENCDISDVSCAKFFNDFWYRLSFRDT